MPMGGPTAGGWCRRFARALGLVRGSTSPASYRAARRLPAREGSLPHSGHAARCRCRGGRASGGRAPPRSRREAARRNRRTCVPVGAGRTGRSGRPTACRSRRVRRRRLSAALKRLRAESGLSVAEAPKGLGWSSAAKLTRAERNEWKSPKRDEVAALLDLYEVEGDDRAHLLSLTEEARGRSDRHKYADLFTGPLSDMEAEATRVRTYETVLMGLRT